MTHLVGISLLCFMEIALSGALWVASVFQQLSTGDDTWLFSILVWFIAGQNFVLFLRMMVSYIAVLVLVMLYESPRR